MITETAIFNPFPGLRSFEADEEHLFFGRERQIDELLARLRRTRFLAVVGTSGSGKSSLVRSGIIPSLHSGFMVQAGSAWRVAVLRPGDDPIGNLAAALARPGVLGSGADDGDAADAADTEIDRPLFEATLNRSTRGLVEAYRQARVPAEENLLVLVDQFEELFRFKRNARIKDSREAATAFVQLLLTATQQGEAPIYVVFTMRSDFIGNCTEFPGLAEATNEGQYLVPRMSREERRAAICGPVAVGGGEISPRLVLRLLNDVGDDPDQLPILQHALLRTWDYWAGHHAAGEPLDLRHYEAIGTLREALSLHAEEAYRELATPREQEVAEKLFKALTEKGADSRGVRRPVRLEEVAGLAGAEVAEVAAVVERFRAPGRSFLMPPAGVPLAGSTVLDISHESLMRAWTRLNGWVDEEARSAEAYRRLSRAAAQHQEGAAGLLRGPELQLALAWREENRPNALWAEHYDPAYERAMLYLEQSRRERDRWVEKRELERRRQLWRTRWLAVVLGTAALLTLLFGLYALSQKVEAENKSLALDRKEKEAKLASRKAKDQAREAVRARTQAEQEKKNAEEQRQKVLAEQARTLAQTRQAEAARAEAEGSRQQAEAARLRAEAAQAGTEAQRAEAVREKERADRLRGEAQVSAAEARRLARLQLARALAIQALRLADGQRPLAGLLALEAYRLDGCFGGERELADPGLYSALRRAAERLGVGEAPLDHPDAVRALVLTGGGRQLLSGGDDGLVRRFDLGRNGAPGSAGSVLARLESGVRSLAVAPGGRQLAIGTLDGTLRRWNLDPPAPGRQVSLQGVAVSALVFDAAGTQLASGGGDGAVRLWDRDLASSLVLLPPQPHRVTALALAPDGHTLAAGLSGGGAGGGSGGGVRLWDLRQPALPPRVLGPAGAAGAAGDVRSLAWSPEGRLAVGSGKGEIELWHAAGTAASRLAPDAVLKGHASGVTALAFAGPRGLLASTGADGSVRLWDVNDLQRDPIVLPDLGAWVWAVALSADGERVFTGGADQKVRTFWSRTEPLAAAVRRAVPRTLTAEERRQYLPDVPADETCPQPRSDR
ncbi:MAG TPA: AAA family ATPase [Thermoanaerobaculia bacterium]|nr:AAA family ATPase [Thermoanaerobaculia bacterium]